ncbi:MAG: hypothetical protein AAF799_35495 [Myxococcota bacterium]
MVRRSIGTGIGSWLLLAACSGTPAASDAQPPAEPAAPERSSGDEAAAILVARIDSALDTWNASCPKANAYGVCVEFVPAESAASRCEPPLLEAVVVHPRDEQRAAVALTELTEAMSMAGCESELSCSREVLDLQPDDPEQARALGRALAAARLARADADLEAYFSLVRPRDPAEHEAYYETMFAHADRLRNDLTLVKSYERADQASTAHAALRLTWAFLHLADQLMDTPSSESGAEDPAARTTQCDSKRERAQVLRGFAYEAAKYCRVRGDSSGAAATARACEDLLQRFVVD